MPKDVDECVKSVMEDNPSYSESRAYAICHAQQNEGNLSEDTTPEDVGRIADAHNVAPSCAMTLANGKELDEDDPCWEGYEQVGMKTDSNGNQVPNCVPAEGGDLSAPRVLAERELAGPIEREENGDKVVYRNLKIISEGLWTDGSSKQPTHYDPAELSVGENAIVNVMHDDESDSSQAGRLKAESYYAEDGAGYVDVELDTSTPAGDFADASLQEALETGGKNGVKGPSIELPSGGFDLEESDKYPNHPKVVDGEIQGLGLVGLGNSPGPAAKDTAFDQQVQERAVAMSNGEDNKAVWTKDDNMPELELQDPGEVREILSMFGFDADDLDDEEVMDMAEDLHEDLMDELGGGEEEPDEAEMEDYEDDEEMPEDKEEDMDMSDLESRVAALEETISSELEGVELAAAGDVKELSETVDSLEEELEEKDKALSNAEERIEELESEPKDPKSLSENGAEESSDDTEYSPISPSQSRGY